jgi:dUTP pyrophosphatase
MFNEDWERVSAVVTVPIQLMGASAVPAYAHYGDAGFDLAIIEDVTLGPGESKLVSCGFSMAIPEGFGENNMFGLFGLIVPRSSSGKLNYSLANTVGVIDSGYRGDIKLFIKNNTLDQYVRLERDQRVAQMILMPYVRAQLQAVDNLVKSERGSGGFGSSGS